MAEGRLLTDVQLQLMKLVEGSDSVELKLTVPATLRRNAVEALGIDPLDAQIRQVFFFDTPALDLNQAGCGRTGTPRPGTRGRLRHQAPPRRAGGPAG